MPTRTRQTPPETHSLGPFEGSDGKTYEVRETVTYTEYQTVHDGQWHRANGPGVRSYTTSRGEDLNASDDGSFLTLRGVVLTPVEP